MEPPNFVGAVFKNFITEGSNLFLFPTTENFLQTLLRNLENYGVFFAKTVFVNHMELDNFASKIVPVPLVTFQFFNSFEPLIWLFIFFSIVLLSILSSICSWDVHHLWKYFWNFTELLFSKSIQPFLTKLESKLIFGVWLLSALYLGIGFTAFILDNMVKAAPVRKLNNLEQLAESGLNIFERGDGTLAAFAKKSNTDLAKRINQQLAIYSNIPDSLAEILEGLRNGSSVLVGSRIYLIFLLRELSEKESFHHDKLFDIMHISKESRGNEPFFLVFTDDIDKWVINAFNRL